MFFSVVITWRNTSEKNKFTKLENRFNVNDYVYIADSDSTEDSSNVTNSTVGSGATASTSNRYGVTPYTIVYQAYENGTAFLMNFNDYRVIVKLNGRTYTLEAYGYIVLSRAA